MFVLVWVYLIILNTTCVYRALQTVTDYRLPAWETVLSSVWMQCSVTQGISSHFLAFSACFPLIDGAFSGYLYFGAPVMVWEVRNHKEHNLNISLPSFSWAWQRCRNESEPAQCLFSDSFMFCLNEFESIFGKIMLYGSEFNGNRQGEWEVKDPGCLLADFKQCSSVKLAELVKTISGHFIIKGLILILNFPNVSALLSKITATAFINICFSLPTRLTIFLVSVSTWFNYWYLCEGTLPPGKRGWMHQCPWIQCTEQINIADLHRDCWLHYFKTPVIDFLKNDISI